MQIKVVTVADADQPALTTVGQVAASQGATSTPMIHVSGQVGAFLEFRVGMKSGDAYTVVVSDGTLLKGRIDGGLRILVAGAGAPSVDDGVVTVRGPLEWVALCAPSCVAARKDTLAFGVETDELIRQ